VRGQRLIGGFCLAAALCAPLAYGATTTNPANSQSCGSGGSVVRYVVGAPTARRVTDTVSCRYPTGAQAMEPSFDVAADGTVLFQSWGVFGPAGLPPQPAVLRSRPPYAHWTDVSPVGPGQSFDPNLILDHRTNRVFSINYAGDGASTCSTMSFSDNEGSSWTSSPLACAGGFDGQSVGVGPPSTTKPVGYPDVIYYCTGTTLTSSPPTSTPVCSKSLDGGVTFVPTGGYPYPVYGAQDYFAPWAGNPIVDADGTLFLPKRYGGEPTIAISHDEGLTWSVRTVAHNGAAGEATRAAVDRDGNVYYAWTGTNHLPYVAYSRDHGVHWSRPLMVAPPGVNEGDLPRVAADHAGHVAIAFLGTTNAPGKPYYAYCNVLLSPCSDDNYAKTRWNGYLLTTTNLFEPHPVVVAATVNPVDRPLFVGGCSADGACKADLDFIDTRLGPDGSPWAIFADDCAVKASQVNAINSQLPRCGDGVGEGIFERLLPTR